MKVVKFFNAVSSDVQAQEVLGLGFQQSTLGLFFKVYLLYVSTLSERGTDGCEPPCGCLFRFSWWLSERCFLRKPEFFA